MTTQTDRSTETTKLRRIVEARSDELRAKDADAFTAHYAPEIVKFDLDPPLDSRGPHALDKKGLEAWFASFHGPIGSEIRDLDISAGADLAFCHGLIRITGARTDGTQTDVWARQTLCFKQIGDTWKIVHEHQSVPFYMDGSLKAAVDLKP